MQAKPYILLVDDDSTAHYLTRRALSSLSYDGQYIEAYDGVEACECIKENSSPQLILLDLRMPGMDGHEFLLVLANGELGEPPPVCVISSSNRPEDQQLAGEFTFVRSCIEKPISKSDVPYFTSLIAELSAPEQPGER